MKKLFFLLLTLTAVTAGAFSQSVETIRIKGSEVPAFLQKEGYKFPSFTRGKVYMKNGDISSVKMNFDYFNNRIKFINEKGDTLVIADESSVKYIAFPRDTFFYDKGYLEWAASSASARIVSKTEFKLADKQLVGPYGTTPTGSKIDAMDAFRGFFNTNTPLEANQEYVFVKRKIYYINNFQGAFAEATKKNISKFFPKKDIDTYIKENRLNLNKEQDLIDVFVYASRPK